MNSSILTAAKKGKAQNLKDDVCAGFALSVL